MSNPVNDPIRRHLVVDSNAQSTPEFVNKLQQARANGPSILIPDALFLEIFKSQGSARSWLNTLVPYDGAFAVARPPGEIIRSEFGGEAVADLINSVGTANLRAFIQDWASRGDDALKDIAPDVEKTKTDAAKESLTDPAFIRSTTTPAFAVLTDLLDTEALKKLRSTTTASNDKVKIRRQLLVEPTCLACIAASMVRGDSEIDRFLILVQNPTCVRASALLTMANFLYDYEHGRSPESLGDKKSVNDVIDGQAILIASLCEGFLTYDKRSISLYEDIRVGLEIQ